MFITADVLRQYNACGPGVKYIERFYPNGAEMIDIIKDRHIEKSFLHWGRKVFSVSEEEFQAYCDACKIENCEDFWESSAIKNSKYISKSKNVENSVGVFESTDVIKSTDIAGSDGVGDSSQIFYSSMIDTCSKIYKGTNIVESSNVCNSTMVARSKNVIDSNTVFDSSEIIGSNTITNSYFCNNCKNISHCMFCDGISDVEYYIFNKPVDQKYFEMFEKQYLKYLTDDLEFAHDWPKDMIVNTHMSPTRKFDDWYHPISEKFWKWARTLPNFDNILLYRITLLSEFIIDKP